MSNSLLIVLGFMQTWAIIKASVIISSSLKYHSPFSKPSSHLTLSSLKTPFINPTLKTYSLPYQMKSSISILLMIKSTSQNKEVSLLISLLIWNLKIYHWSKPSSKINPLILLTQELLNYLKVYTLLLLEVLNNVSRNLSMRIVNL
jgi:hypothetical protein